MKWYLIESANGKLEHKKKIKDLLIIKKEIVNFFGPFGTDNSELKADDSEDLSYIEHYIPNPKNCSLAKHSSYIDSTDYDKIEKWWKALRPKLSSDYILEVRFCTDTAIIVSAWRDGDIPMLGYRGHKICVTY